MKNGWFSEKRQQHYISSYDITNPNSKSEERKIIPVNSIDYDVVIIGIICLISCSIIILSKLGGVI